MRQAGSFSALGLARRPGRAWDPRFPSRGRKGPSSRALPRGIVCELAWRSQAQGPAPPEKTRHASDRAHSRPPLASSQQPPPPATSSPPPQLPWPPRRAGTRRRRRARPLGPGRRQRGWDRTDVAHARWRHQAREPWRRGRRRGRPRARPPGPRSWGRRRRGLARPCGRCPTAAGGAVR